MNPFEIFRMVGVVAVNREEALRDLQEIQAGAQDTSQGMQAGFQQTQTVAGRASEGIRKGFAALNTWLKTTLIGALVAVGAALIGLAKTGVQNITQIHDAMQRFRVETGASAEEAERFSATIQALHKVNTDSYEDLANAVTAVRQRYGDLGDAMQPVTQSFLNFAKVTKQDTATAVREVDAVLQAWNLDLEHSGELMDMLLAAEQESGVAAERLQSGLTRNAVLFQSLGMAVDESIAFLAQFERQGIATERLVGGLSNVVRYAERPTQEYADAFRALGIAVDDAGRPLGGAKAVLDGIQEAAAQGTLTQEQMAAASTILGNRVASDMVRGLQSGEAAMDDLIATVRDSQGAVTEASNQYDKQLGERWTLIRRRYLEPFMETIGSGLLWVLEQTLTGIERFAGFVERAFDSMARGVKTVVSGLLSFTSGIVDRLASIAEAVPFLSDDWAQDLWDYADRLRETSEAYKASAQAVEEQVEQSGERITSILSTAGKDAGAAAGQGIAEGLEESADDIAAAARIGFDRAMSVWDQTRRALIDLRQALGRITPEEAISERLELDFSDLKVPTGEEWEPFALRGLETAERQQEIAEFYEYWRGQIEDLTDTELAAVTRRVEAKANEVQAKLGRENFFSDTLRLLAQHVSEEQIRRADEAAQAEAEAAEQAAQARQEAAEAAAQAEAETARNRMHDLLAADEEFYRSTVGTQQDLFSISTHLLNQEQDEHEAFLNRRAAARRADADKQRAENAKSLDEYEQFLADQLAAYEEFARNRDRAAADLSNYLAQLGADRVRREQAVLDEQARFDQAYWSWRVALGRVGLQEELEHDRQRIESLSIWSTEGRMAMEQFYEDWSRRIQGMSSEERQALRERLDAWLETFGPDGAYAGANRELYETLLTLHNETLERATDFSKRMLDEVQAYGEGVATAVDNAFRRVLETIKWGKEYAEDYRVLLGETFRTVIVDLIGKVLVATGILEAAAAAASSIAAAIASLNPFVIAAAVVAAIALVAWINTELAKLGEGSGSSPSPPGGGGGGGGIETPEPSPGHQVSEITGPTRDTLVDLLSPLANLDSLIGLQYQGLDLDERRNEILEEILGRVASPAATGVVSPLAAVEAAGSGATGELAVQTDLLRNIRDLLADPVPQPVYAADGATFPVEMEGSVAGMGADEMLARVLLAQRRGGFR